MLPLTLLGTEGTMLQKSFTDVTQPLSRKIQSCLVTLRGHSQHASEHNDVRPDFSQYPRISLYSKFKLNLRNYRLSMSLTKG